VACFSEPDIKKAISLFRREASIYKKIPIVGYFITNTFFYTLTRRIRKACDVSGIIGIYEYLLYDFPEKKVDIFNLFREKIKIEDLERYITTGCVEKDTSFYLECETAQRVEATVLSCRIFPEHRMLFYAYFKTLVGLERFMLFVKYKTKKCLPQGLEALQFALSAFPEEKETIINYYLGFDQYMVIEKNLPIISKLLEYAIRLGIIEKLLKSSNLCQCYGYDYDTMPRYFEKLKGIFYSVLIADLTTEIHLHWERKLFPSYFAFLDIFEEKTGKQLPSPVRAILEKYIDPLGLVACILSPKEAVSAMLNTLEFEPQLMT
jgi:hypothetical protein